MSSPVAGLQQLRVQPASDRYPPLVTRCCLHLNVLKAPLVLLWYYLSWQIFNKQNAKAYLTSHKLVTSMVGSLDSRREEQQQQPWCKILGHILYNRAMVNCPVHIKPANCQDSGHSLIDSLCREYHNICYTVVS